MNISELFSGNVRANVDANGVKLESNLLNVSSQLKQPHTVVSRGRRSEENWSSSGTPFLDQQQSADDANLCSTSPVCDAPIIRQFWKAGVYNNELTSKATNQCIYLILMFYCLFLF